MSRTGPRRLASVRVRVAHRCFPVRGGGINGTPWLSWGATGEVIMSVDHVDETTGEAAREAAGEAVRAQAATALRYYAVAPGVRLNVRSGPGTGYPIVKVL